MDALGVSSEITAPLAGGNCRAQVIIVMLMKRVQCLRVGIADEVIQVLRLPKTRMLRAGGRMMMRRERRWKVRGLKVRRRWQGCTTVMRHSAAISIPPMTMMMGTRVRRRVSAAQRGNPSVTSQSVLSTRKNHVLYLFVLSYFSY